MLEGEHRDGRNYIMPIAFTKNVKRKGSVNQNHSGARSNKVTHATNETSVISQYILRFSTFSVFTSLSMLLFLVAQT